PYRQLSRRQLWKIQCQVDDLAVDIVRDPVPDTIWSGAEVTQRLGPTFTVSITPAVERGAGDAEFVQGALGRQKRLLDQLDKPSRMQDTSCLVLPIPAHAFFSRRFSRVRSATTSFKAGPHDEGPSPRRTSPRGPCRPPTGACRPPGTPSTSRNTSK